MRLIKLLPLVVIATGFVSFGNTTIPYFGQKQSVLAMNIPNFQPRVSFRNGVLVVDIPSAMVQAGLSETIRANEGDIKSTEFNQINLSNMRATVINNGIRVEGNWQYRHRERTVKNPFTGKWSHTPWTSVSGNFSQNFNVRVTNGRLFTETNGNPSISSSQWYGEILQEVIYHLGVRQNVKNQLDTQLASFNGLNLQRLLVDYGANSAASALGVDSNSVASAINSNVGRINASLSGNGLSISLGIPALQRTNYEELTQKLYRDILGREADSDGLRNWSNWMRERGFDSARSGIANSQESKNNINNIYRQYLCRDADSGGMTHHVNLLASGQATLAALRANIPQSPEAQLHKNGCR